MPTGNNRTASVHPSAVKDFAAEAAELCDLLSENNLTRLDFDDLRLWLTHAAEHLSANHPTEDPSNKPTSELDSARRDLQLLRDDYRARIAGMLKAITISERSKLTLDSLSDLIASLSTMSAEDLIACYRRTSALFRDHFPTTLPTPIGKPS